MSRTERISGEWLAYLVHFDGVVRSLDHLVYVDRAKVGVGIGRIYKAKDEVRSRHDSIGAVAKGAALVAIVLWL